MNYDFIIRYIRNDDVLKAINELKDEINLNAKLGYQVSAIFPLQYEGTTTMLVAIMET